MNKLDTKSYLRSIQELVSTHYWHCVRRDGIEAIREHLRDESIPIEQAIEWSAANTEWDIYPHMLPWVLASSNNSVPGWIVSSAYNKEREPVQYDWSDFASSACRYLRLKDVSSWVYRQLDEAKEIFQDCDKDLKCVLNELLESCESFQKLHEGKLENLECLTEEAGSVFRRNSHK